MTILLLEPIHDDAAELLRDYDRTMLATSTDALEAAVQHEPIQAILTRGRGQISAALIARCRDLRVVARCGVGLDNIDVAAAKVRGVAVIYAPGSTTTAVAEHTLLLLLAIARRLHPIASAVDAGHWEVRDGYTGAELAGKTLGVLGLGAIGRRVAELGSLLGMHVITWSRSSSDPRFPALPFDQVLHEADIVSVHVALTAETRKLIGARELGLMRPGAFLINTARGGLIDQPALVVALDTGRLGGFAADVLDQEPPSPHDGLLRSERALITPHIAALTDVTYRLMCVRTANNVLAVLRGEQPEPGTVFK